MMAGTFAGGVDIYVYLRAAAPPAEPMGESAGVRHRRAGSGAVAGAQIVGGLLTPWVRRAFKRRTSALLILGILAVVMLALMG